MHTVWELLASQLATLALICFHQVAPLTWYRCAVERDSGTG